MNSWAIVVIVAIAFGSFVKMYQARYGIVRDRRGRETFIQREDTDAKREIEDLRERIKVLERIATDANSPQQREIQSISDEIEKLRDR